MKSRIVALSAATLSALLSACSLFQPGLPAASVSVSARSESVVEDVVERVFTEDGYQVSGRSVDTITFEKATGKTDRVLYGDWIGGEISQRARIVIDTRGEGKFRVRCLPSIVRDPHDAGFEDEHRRMQLFSFHYSHLLREVRRQLQ